MQKNVSLSRHLLGVMTNDTSKQQK